LRDDGSLRLTAGDRAALKGANVSAVLAPDAYSLQLVEAPNVAPDEVGEAVRWRIQHLIEFPVEEAIVETFEMPAPANPGASAMVYAVVAHRDEIARCVDRLRQENLRIGFIDIPELCLRNISVQLPQDAAGVALLHFVHGYGYLTITRGGVLYLLRRIETQHGEFHEAPDEVALQVQRSLDHYESHYDCRPVNHLVIGPGEHSGVLASSLAANLGITVSGLDLGAIFSADSEYSADADAVDLLAVGAALRELERAA